MKKVFWILAFVLIVVGTGGYVYFQSEPKAKDVAVLDFGNINSDLRNIETKTMSPYAQFGDSSVVLTTKQERTGTWEIENNDPKAKVRKMVFHSRTGTLTFYGRKGRVIGEIIMPAKAVARFLRPDRYAEKYYGLSPYQYGANNPINNIDVNGDSIIVNAGGNRYSYGFTQTGGYGFYDNKGGLYSGNDKYLNAVNSALGRLGLGKEGRTLVDRLTASTDAIEIRNTTGGNQANFAGRSRSIDWSENNLNGGPDEKGNTTRRAFIGLGHEMAHMEDAIYGTMNSRQGTWVNDPTVQDAKGNPLNIPNMEIYATHRENQLRSEQGIPLRTGYIPNYSGARIINVSTRSSLYYDANGNSYFDPKSSTFSTVPRGNQPFKY